jgi:FkbM family methyltransferase
MRSIPIRGADKEYLDRRIALTTSCDDTRNFCRVSNAGEIIEKNGFTLQIMHNGILIEKDGYCGTWMTEIIKTLGGVHEPQEELAYSILLEYLKKTALPGSPDLVCVELGSYWAYYAMWFLLEFPMGKAICIEPDPFNLDLGKRHFRLNNLSGEFSQMFVAIENEGFTEFVTQKTKDTITVPKINLSGILSRYNLSQIDILLMDIQGSEDRILLSSIELLSQRKIKYLIISTHDESISGSSITHQRVIDCINQTGGSILCEHTVYESCSGDGLVFATYNDSSTFPSIPISRMRAKDSLFGEPELKIDRLQAKISDLESSVSQIKFPVIGKDITTKVNTDSILRLQSRLNSLEAKILAIESSEVWKMTLPIRKFIGIFRRTRRNVSKS